MENHFLEVKKMAGSFTYCSISNMAGYVFISPKMNLWSDVTGDVFCWKASCPVYLLQFKLYVQYSRHSI